MERVRLAVGVTGVLTLAAALVAIFRNPESQVSFILFIAGVVLTLVSTIRTED